jgi:hypothetical protein
MKYANVDYGIQEDELGKFRWRIYPKIEQGPKVISERFYASSDEAEKVCQHEIHDGLKSARDATRLFRSKGEKHPGDKIGAAVRVGKIATGEIEDLTTEDGKNAAAVALGRMGGRARAARMSAKRRKEIAKKAAKTRWSK